MDRDAVAVGLLNAKFRTTQFETGYAEGEVDDFVDVLVWRIREGESVELIRDAIQTHHFSTTKWRRGYNIADVDSTLEALITTLTTASS